MKRLICCLLPAVALALAGCSKGSENLDAEGSTGDVAMTFTTRAEAADGGYDPMQHLTVRLYNDKGELIRKYTSQERLPERLELLAGTYRAAVEAGEEEAASFTKRFYRGEEPFTVTAGQTTPVEVKCTLQNAAVAVAFEASVAENFGSSYSVSVMPGESYDEDRANDPSTLRYTTDATGYFTLAEGVDALSWHFSGKHASRGEVEQSGTITGVKTPGRYTLTFRYSPDQPGLIEAVTIRVDDSTDDYDDTIIWSPDPTIEGIGFDLDQPQLYTGGEKQIRITTVKPMTSARLTLNDTPYDLLAAVTSPVAGLQVVKESETALTVTLTEDLFAGCSGGDQTLRFEVRDNAGGRAEATCLFALEGLVVPTSSDYDLWHNTLNLRARIFDSSATVTFGVRTEGGSWIEKEGSNSGDGLWSASFGVEWEESANENGQTVYTPKEGTGIWAGKRYECRVVVNGKESLASFSTADGQTIPGGDMEDGSMSCFNNGHGSFWDSGNNSMSDPLCVQSSYTGMQGSACARLQANKPILLVNLAAGNLFTGSFAQSGTSGTVSFGQPYDWQARPQKMHVLYYAETLGQVNQNQHGGPLATGEQDQARIFVAIVDWNATHAVTSGSSSPKGIWDPAKGIYGGDNATQAEGKIIGYGSLVIDRQSTEGSMISVDIPIRYYDTETRPSGRYTLVISCATSAYGDYMNGCTSNVLYVDDFRWIY